MSPAIANAVDAVLADRHSCRAFRDEEVSRPDIEWMLERAQRTASWCNAQPWQVVVVSGEARRRLADALTARARLGERRPDVPPPLEYRGVYGERRRESGYALYGSLGIRREDRERREQQRLENFRFFDAPHTAIVSTEQSLGMYGAADCGAYVSSLMLAAQSLGIATVAQAAVAMHSDVVREQLSIAEDRLILCAVSFGYEDDAHPGNAFRTSRASLAEAVRWESE
jgi:nitroreductase